MYVHKINFWWNNGGGGIGNQNQSFGWKKKADLMVLLAGAPEWVDHPDHSLGAIWAIQKFSAISKSIRQSSVGQEGQKLQTIVIKRPFWPTMSSCTYYYCNKLLQTQKLGRFWLKNLRLFVN